MNDDFDDSGDSPSAALRILLLCGLVVASFILHIGLRTAIVTEGYQVGTGRRELARLEARHQDLKVQRDRLLSGRNLERLVAEYAKEGEVFAPPLSRRLIFEQPEGLKDR